MYAVWLGKQRAAYRGLQMLRPLGTSVSFAVGLFMMHLTTAEDAEVRRGAAPGSNTLIHHYVILSPVARPSVRCYYPNELSIT